MSKNKNGIYQIVWKSCYCIKIKGIHNFLFKTSVFITFEIYQKMRHVYASASLTKDCNFMVKPDKNFMKL